MYSIFLVSLMVVLLRLQSIGITVLIRDLRTFPYFEEKTRLKVAGIMLLFCQLLVQLLCLMGVLILSILVVFSPYPDFWMSWLMPFLGILGIMWVWDYLDYSVKEGFAKSPLEIAGALSVWFALWGYLAFLEVGG